MQVTSTFMHSSTDCAILQMPMYMGLSIWPSVLELLAGVFMSIHSGIVLTTNSGPYHWWTGSYSPLLTEIWLDVFCRFTAVRNTVGLHYAA